MNFSNLKSKYRKGRPASGAPRVGSTRDHRGPTRRSGPYETAVRLLLALLIRDLFDDDRQVAGHAVDRSRDALRRRVEHEHQLTDQLLFRWQRGQGVDVFDVDYAAFDNAGFEFELSVLLGELAQHLGQSDRVCLAVSDG